MAVIKTDQGIRPFFGMPLDTPDTPNSICYFLNVIFSFLPLLILGGIKKNKKGVSTVSGNRRNQSFPYSYSGHTWTFRGCVRTMSEQWRTAYAR
jgi:hypothetical protein